MQDLFAAITNIPPTTIPNLRQLKSDLYRNFVSPPAEQSEIFHGRSTHKIETCQKNAYSADGFEAENILLREPFR